MQRLILWTLVFIAASIAPSVSRAGVWEVGASGSYRRQNIDVNAVDEAQSLTGSVSYYLDEQSAIELSYTDGISKRSINPDVVNGHITMSIYKTVGLDFIYTFGSGSARPYVKIGGAYFLEKKIVDQYLTAGGAWNPTTIETPPSIVPSAGVGFKISIASGLSLKAGVDASTSNALSVQPVSIDFTGRAGLSWMFQ
jgi:hypothetical protein